MNSLDEIFKEYKYIDKSIYGYCKRLKENMEKQDFDKFLNELDGTCKLCYELNGVLISRQVICSIAYKYTVKKRIKNECI